MSTEANSTIFRFSRRTDNIKRSFIREILKVSTQSNVISFAGGLPNPTLFPVEGIKSATAKVLSSDGEKALQYSITQGYYPLREYIAKRYQESELDVTPEEIIITNGSQQALDLIGKVFLDSGDTLLLERPSYLGAIQAFSCYEPKFLSVPLESDGVRLQEFEEKLKVNPKLFYSIPNFQNPTGISYSETKREQVGALISKSDTIIVEDNPYGEINFTSKKFLPIKKWARGKGILLGSFSKIVSPGMRIGWLVADKPVVDKILVAKEATDLHSNQLAQMVIYQYLVDNDLQGHIEKVSKMYKEQRDWMISEIHIHFPPDTTLVVPEGGMFCWIKLPSEINAFELIERSMKQGVLFVPGGVFYTDNVEKNTMRINYTNSSLNQIKLGMEILGQCIQELKNS